MSDAKSERKFDDTSIRLARALVRDAARRGTREPEYVEKIAALPLLEEREQRTA